MAPPADSSPDHPLVSENESAESGRAPHVQPTAYHREVLNYLQKHEAELWQWFSSHQARSDSADAMRVELLKTAYRIDREAAPAIYEIVDQLVQKMAIHSAVTLYQAQNAVGLNASIAWLPGEAHIVLHGSVQELLSPEELAAVLTHELAHHELYRIDDGHYLVQEQILSAMITDRAAEPPHVRTWRSHRLWTELHCDRRAADVTENVEACITALVKMETGLHDVSAHAYLHQAEEVLAHGLQVSDGVTHPEMFIRARALQLWQENPDSVDDQLRILVEGPLKLETLDLLQQRALMEVTASFVIAFLQPKWMQTDLMLRLAQRLLTSRLASDVTHLSSVSDVLRNPSEADLIAPLQGCDQRLRDYFCYVLLDFVTQDPDLEEGPLASAFLFADSTGLLAEFRGIASKELRLGKRALEKVENDADKLVLAAEKEFSS